MEFTRDIIVRMKEVMAVFIDSRVSQGGISFVSVLVGEEVVRFNKDVVDKMGSGFCYLRVFDDDFMAYALRQLKMFPIIPDFLSFTARFYFEDFSLQIMNDALLHVVPPCITDDEDHYTVTFRCCDCYSLIEVKVVSMKVNCGSCWERHIASGLEVVDTGNYYVGGILSMFRGKPQQRQSSSSKTVARFSKEVDPGVSQSAMKDAERELYQFEKPKQELGITDLLKQHNSGERFLYAAVTSSEGEDDAGLLRRLTQYQPKLNRQPIDPGKLPVLELFKDVEMFPLSIIIPQKKSKTNTYIRIVDVIAVYGSLVSYDYAFSKAKISIIDNRFLGNKTSKSAVIGTNIISKTNLSLSYCFPRNEAKDISLTVSRESAFLEEGRQWGTIQLMIQLEETDFPTQHTNKAVRAVNNIPKGMMEDRQLDPDTLDITILDNDRHKLREIYLEGDVADETEPIKNKMEATRYAKSSLGGPKGKKKEVSHTPDWSFMNENRVGQIQAGENSVEPSEDGSIRGYPRDLPSPETMTSSPPARRQYDERPISPINLSSPLSSSPESKVRFEMPKSAMKRPLSPRRVRVIDVEEDYNLP